MKYILTSEENRLWRFRFCTKRSNKRVCRDGTPIEFKLTYEEYLDLIFGAGVQNQYGKGRDKYCLCRYNDQGHYEIGNVFIQKFSNNIRDANTLRTGTMKYNTKKEKK